MADISFKKSKGEILSGMMKNPSIAKTIKEALESRPGSTSRQKARKIFNIMQKLHESHDGLGGPGMMYERMAEAPQPNYQQSPPENPRGIIIFHKIPKPNIVYGNKPVKKIDGIGGPGKFDGKGGMFDMSGFSPYKNIQSTNTNNNLGQSFATPVTPTTTPVDSNQASGGFLSNVWGGLKNFFTAPAYPTPTTTATTPRESAIEMMNKQKATADETMNAIKGIFATPKISGMTYVEGRGYIPDAQFKEEEKKKAEQQPISIKDSSGTDITLTPEQKQQYGITSQNSQYHWVGDNGELYRWNGTSGDIVDANFGKSTANNIAKTPEETSYENNWKKVSGTAGASGSAASGDKTGTFVGYGAEIIPEFDKNKTIGSLTPEERTKLYDAQKKREGSTLPNNPFGIKQGGATQHWLDEGLAVLGSKATDGGQFLVFKDPATAKAAYEELLYGPNYSNLTIDAAMKKWSGYGPAETADTTDTTDTTLKNADGTTKSYQDQVFDRWKIPEMREEIKTLEDQEKVLADARDTYLLQTDTAINNFMDTINSSQDMSNPANIASAAGQLNYLYGLRGRANQSYLSHLNDSIASKQESIKNKVSYYNTALTGVENEIRNAATITPDQAEAFQVAINQVYNSAMSDEQKLLEIQELSKRALNGEITSISDTLANDEKYGLISTSKKVEDYINWDGKTTVDHIPSLVNMFNELAISEPTIQPRFALQAYKNLVDTYINSANERKRVASASGGDITSETKRTILEQAIEEFGKLAYYSSTGQLAGGNTDPAIIAFANSTIQGDLIPRLATEISTQLSSSAPGIMTAVEKLAPGTGMFGGNKATPTSEEFVAQVSKATGGNASAMEAAPSIYAYFMKLQEGQPEKAPTTDNPQGTPAVPAQTREDAVKTLLYETSSTSTENTRRQPNDFARIVGYIFAQDIASEFYNIQ